MPELWDIIMADKSLERRADMEFSAPGMKLSTVLSTASVFECAFCGGSSAVGEDGEF